jgi:NAD+ diphosphatase
MNHTARFAADSLHKQYPEPDRIPDGALLVLVRNNRICIRTGIDRTIFVRDSLKIADFVRENAHYLGHLGSAPCYAYDAGNLPVSGCEDSGVRELAGIISDEELAIAGLAVQVVDYDRTTRYCGRCGARTDSSRSERAKICPACRNVTYPRISPAIIVLVRKGDTILLVRGKRAPVGRYSLVAGFVEPGETIEHAVHREVQEEAGIEIKNVRYLASEPWPFPNSLMSGFVADYAGGTIHPDGIEIEAAGWFGRDKLPDFPPKLSIAHTLIERWASGKMDTVP